jgi:hypothetical protein
VVHSLRHRARDRLRGAGCPEDVRWALLGHEEKTVAAGFGEGFPVPLLRKWIDKIGRAVVVRQCGNQNYEAPPSCCRRATEDGPSNRRVNRAPRNDSLVGNSFLHQWQRTERGINGLAPANLPPLPARWPVNAAGPAPAAPTRPFWKGYLKLSLVSCPIALFHGTSSTERVSFRQVNRARVDSSQSAGAAAPAVGGFGRLARRRRRARPIATTGTDYLKRNWPTRRLAHCAAPSPTDK